MKDLLFVDPLVDRRRFLRFGAGTLGVFGLGLPLHAVQRASNADPTADPTDGTLVLIQLSGGNDGLATVVPFGDDEYHRVRPTAGIAEAEVLRLDDRRALHPALPELYERFQAGTLAIVEGVGYPQPNRSHFKSLDIWHAADQSGRRVGNGWIGRLAEQAFADADPLRVVHVGATVPFSLVSQSRPPIGFVSPSTYRRIGLEDEPGLEPALREAGETGETDEPQRALEHVRRVMRDARSSSERLRGAVAHYRPRVEYPDDPFAAGLRTVAAIIEAGIGTRVLSIELSGFDTHNDQRGRHDRLMERLDAGLGAFLADLSESEAGRAALVLAFSEFGRRVAENGSRGTDHGTAGPVFVAGSRVRGGFFGKIPDLSKLDEGDLVHTTDFRSVYATLIEALFDVSPERVLGKRYPILDFV